MTDSRMQTLLPTTGCILCGVAVLSCGARSELTATSMDIDSGSATVPAVEQDAQPSEVSPGAIPGDAAGARLWREAGSTPPTIQSDGATGHILYTQGTILGALDCSSG